MDENSQALARVPTTEINTQQINTLANELRPMFPQDLNTKQAMQLARIAIEYKLDPMMGEIIPYQGQPFVTVDGHLRIANREPQYDGFDNRPATEEEREGLRAADDEIVWVAEVWRKDRSRPTRAYGRAGGQAERNNLVSGKNKRNTVFIQPADQALIRALRRALRMSFSLRLPGVDDGVTAPQLRAIHTIDEQAGIDREQRHAELKAAFDVESSKDLTKDQASAYIDDRLVDAETGEIVESELDEQPEPSNGNDEASRPVSGVGIDHLNTLAKRLNLEEFTIHETLQDRFGVERFQDLTAAQARELSDVMKQILAEQDAAVQEAASAS